MAYIKRAAEDTIARVSKMFPVLLVTGPRLVGKTTLLERLADIQKSEGIERKYVTLDDLMSDIWQSTTRLCFCNGIPHRC